MEKLTALRALMQAQGIDAYILTGADPHGSGYAPAHWKTREWLSGFTGSNGLAVVTRDKAGLWTDGRYFLQAEQELEGSGFTLYKMEEPGVPTYQAFLKKNLPEGGCVGFDGRTLRAQSFDTLEKVLAERGAKFTLDSDLVGELWQERPVLPAEPAFAHEPRFAGASAGEKLIAVREQMTKKNIGGYIISALDDIAWLLNIRGRDLPYTPVVYAHAYITQAAAYIFVDAEKVRGLLPEDFTQLPYDDFISFVRIVSEPDLAGGKIYFNVNKTSVAVAEGISKELPANHNANDDIITALKARKTAAELENIRNAYKKEGAVFVRLLIWLEGKFTVEPPASGTLPLYEGDITRKLRELRSAQPDYLHDSFSTIAAYGANAASAHYNPGENGAEILREGFLLIDTGGQYLDGTTDTTRTIAIGEITDEMRRDFTLVLKGHIALATAQFPQGTTGTQLDILARHALWREGKNYRHGTGHGIGYVLNVHEGPHNIATRHNAAALALGMLTSNEPGMYKDGEYGIRTENILCVKEIAETEYGTFLGFENLTFTPIDLRAVDLNLLSDCEKKYLSDYHKATYDALSPLLNEAEQAWLREATREI